MPQASIIICTCNRAESLKETLASMTSLAVPADLSVELVVVDNGSTDHTKNVVAHCAIPDISVRYVLESRRGQCFARNRGISETTGEVIIFTDDDVRPAHNWIEGMCRPILTGLADAVAGGVHIAPHLQRPW